MTTWLEVTVGLDKHAVWLENSQTIIAPFGMEVDVKVEDVAPFIRLPFTIH